MVNGSAVNASSRTTARWNGSAVAMPSTTNSSSARRARSSASVARLAGDDQLGQQRVERAADHRVALDAGVDAHARTGRLAVGRDRARGGQEVAARVLAVDPELERVPARGRVVVEAQLLALGDAELLAHEVDAAGLLGDRVLHLQAGVDLEEADDAVGADQVLDRARAVVVRPRGRSPWPRRGCVARCSSVRNGAGASSTSFWLRRCSEQSRVPTTMTLPCWSASTCASTWRDRSR